MKKIFICLLLFCVGLVNAQETRKEAEIPHYFGENGQIVVHNITDPKESFDIIEITYDGETHQFIRYRRTGIRPSDCNVGGLSHWPGCKYCKSHKENKSNENESNEHEQTEQEYTEYKSIYGW